VLDDAEQPGCLRRSEIVRKMILFLHGWQSVPGGVKPTFLAAHGHSVINPKLPDEDFGKALRIAQAEFDKHKPAVIVGSSRGGAVAMNINYGHSRLVLLCPAWKKWGTATTVAQGTVILHSRADDIVPFAASEELVGNSGLPAGALIETGSDHRLADPEPLRRMLQAFEARRATEDDPVKQSNRIR
jgi:pimeloyl-ACP methyl ester carboxylesterase